MQFKMIFLVLILSFTSMADVNLRGHVVETKIGLEDQAGQETLCLTVIELDDRKVGILEDITDCFYAREYKNGHGREIEIPTFFLSPELHPQYSDMELYFNELE